MKLKVPKTERRKSTDSKARRIWRRVMLIGIAVVLLGLAGVHLFSVGTGTEELSGPGDMVSSVLTPIQRAFSTAVDWVADYLRTVKLRSRIELEYNEIRQENERLSYQAMLAEHLQNKLSVYETLFDEVSQNEAMNPLVATVIGRGDGNYFSVFTIDKGVSDGVEENMAVTVGGALVGYIESVNTHSSVVRAIIDSDASIASLISSSRDQGTVRGTLGIDGQPMCRMYYLTGNTLPRPGDSVVTSGVSMSFPKGIPIGTVRESTRGMENNKQYVVVEPQADFEHIEYVIVLRYKPQADEVQVDGSESTAMEYVALPSVQPVPTIQIGSEFYQLAPTPTPSPEPSPTETMDEEGNLITPAPSPDSTQSGDEIVYQVPSSMQTDPGYGFTIPPTATPTPTPPPLDLSVEED